jgi:hypothetical protein
LNNKLKRETTIRPEDFSFQALMRLTNASETSKFA